MPYRFDMNMRSLVSTAAVTTSVIALLAATAQSAGAASIVKSSPSQTGTIHQCSSVRGGALSKTLVSGITCVFAQRIWNHFSWDSSRPRPPLPHGWRCVSMLTGSEQSETDCVGLSWTIWARFYET